MSKPTLEEMATLCGNEAGMLRNLLRHRAERFPHVQLDAVMERQALVFETAAYTLGLMGTFEDKSRNFIVALQKEWGR